MLFYIYILIIKVAAEAEELGRSLLAGYLEAGRSGKNNRTEILAYLDDLTGRLLLWPIICDDILVAEPRRPTRSRGVKGT